MDKTNKLTIIRHLSYIVATFAVFAGLLLGGAAFAQTDTTTTTSSSDVVKTGDIETKHFCGKGPNAPADTSNQVNVSFNFGCKGDDPSYTGTSLNPIVDIAFAIFRFLSAGVGIVVIGSIIVAGIQYAASRGEPQATHAAITRVSNSLIALLIYVFMFAIANYLVPGGMFI